MTYDSWKATEPDREPAPGEHRPYDDACDCAECMNDRYPEEKQPMAPWFQKVLDTCESLSLDNARDRQILWERISEAWPKDAIEAMIADNVEPNHDDAHPAWHSKTVSRCTAAVIAALEES